MHKLLLLLFQYLIYQLTNSQECGPSLPQDLISTGIKIIQKQQAQNRTQLQVSFPFELFPVRQSSVESVFSTYQVIQGIFQIEYSASKSQKPQQNIEVSVTGKVTQNNIIEASLIVAGRNWVMVSIGYFITASDLFLVGNVIHPVFARNRRLGDLSVPTISALVNFPLKQASLVDPNQHFGMKALISAVYSTSQNFFLSITEEKVDIEIKEAKIYYSASTTIDTASFAYIAYQITDTPFEFSSISLSGTYLFPGMQIMTSFLQTRSLLSICRKKTLINEVNSPSDRQARCQNSNFYDKDQNRCMPCPAFCSKCLDSYICQKCQDGFVIDAVLLQTFGSTFCKSQCGDGFQNILEECDDGNIEDGDGCSYECMIQDNYSCFSKDFGLRSICSPYNDNRVYFEISRTIVLSKYAAIEILIKPALPPCFDSLCISCQKLFSLQIQDTDITIFSYLRHMGDNRFILYFQYGPGQKLLNNMRYRIGFNKKTIQDKAIGTCFSEQDFLPSFTKILTPSVS